MKPETIKRSEVVEYHKIDGYQKFIRDLKVVRNLYSLMTDPVIYETLRMFVKNYYMNLEYGGKLILFGNGGSAADCDHIVGEFMNRFVYNRYPFEAISLANSAATLTAIGNDVSYEEIFSRQFMATAKQCDSVVALTTSGKSKNIINVLKVTDPYFDINSLIITGLTNQKIDHFKYHIQIPIEYSKRTVARIQEATMFLLHQMCSIFDDYCELYDNRYKT